MRGVRPWLARESGGHIPEVGVGAAIFLRGQSVVLRRIPIPAAQIKSQGGELPFPQLRKTQRAHLAKTSWKHGAEPLLEQKNRAEVQTGRDGRSRAMPDIWPFSSHLEHWSTPKKQKSKAQ